MTILKKDAKLPPPPISSTIAEIEIGETITNLLSPGWLPLMSGMTSVAPRLRATSTASAIWTRNYQKLHNVGNNN